MKILNIPFISKPKAISKTLAIAKYIINKNGEIIDEWCELLEWTELRWKSNYGKKFDNNIIEFRKNIMFDDSKDEILSKEKLDIINTYFYKNLTTILNHDKLTTGSNPTGSDHDFRKTPYLIYGWKYNQFLFINFFKTLRLKNKDKNIRNQVFENVNLDQYFELFPTIKQDFLDFNKILFTALESNDIEQTKEIDTRDDINGIIDLILSPEYEIQKNISEEQRNEKRVQTLRRIFKNRMRWIKPSDHLLWEYPEDMCESAHIFPVSEIKKLNIEKWYMIADENNGINIPTQFHKLYDNNKIYFDENNGKIHFTNEIYKDHLKKLFSQNEYQILENLLNNKRKNYIEMYNKKFIAHYT